VDPGAKLGLEEYVVGVFKGPMVAKVLVALAVGLALPGTAGAKRCGHVAVGSGLKAKVRVVYGDVRCGKARVVIKSAYHAEASRSADGSDSTYGYYWRVRGFRCYTGLAGSETFCHRGRKQVDGSTRTDDGWYFASDQSDATHRLSAKAWVRKINKLSRELKADFAPLRIRGHDPHTWFMLARRLRHLNRVVDAIRPPRAAARVNSAIVAGLAPLPLEVHRVGIDLRRGQRRKARADAIKLEKSLIRLIERIGKAVAHG
jgi:hypothetical protein